MINCCCQYGAAVSGEFPEMPCYMCPQHGGELSMPDEACKRHTRESEQRTDTLDSVWKDGFQTGVADQKLATEWDSEYGANRTSPYNVGDQWNIAWSLGYAAGVQDQRTAESAGGTVDMSRKSPYPYIPEPLPSPTTEVDADGRFYIDWHETEAPKGTPFVPERARFMPLIPGGLQLLACPKCGAVVSEFGVDTHTDFHRDLGPEFRVGY